MFLIQKIGNRTAGMGLKIVKFHAIAHMAQDIFDFGVQMEVDTGANESGHKAEKKAAKLTQNNCVRFDLQSRQRMMEMFLLNLVKEEMNGLEAWTYFEPKDQIVPKEAPIEPPHVGGAQIIIWYDTHCETLVAKVQNSRNRNDVSLPVEQSLQCFVKTLQQKLSKIGHFVPLCTHHKCKGAIFCAQATFETISLA